MALIAMCCHDTEENQRTELTRRTLYSIKETVDLNKHRLFVIDNGSCEKTKTLLVDLQEWMRFTIITNPINVGTAKGINQAWKLRKSGEHVIKMDNDVEIHQKDWVDLLEEAISRAPDQIGICCLKRKDLAERPYYEERHWGKSTLHMLHQEPGERCIIIEEVKHAMGTVQMYNSELIDKIGGLYQFDATYAFDDSLAGVRAQIAGFISCFIPYIEIDHIDKGGDDYTAWKHKYAGEMMPEFNRIRAGYINGSINIFHPFE